MIKFIQRQKKMLIFAGSINDFKFAILLLVRSINRSLQNMNYYPNESVFLPGEGEH